VADGIYHLGFEMRWGRLLAEDLAKGTLANPNIAPNLPAIAATVVYAFAGPFGLGRVA